MLIIYLSVKVYRTITDPNWSFAEWLEKFTIGALCIFLMLVVYGTVMIWIDQVIFWLKTDTWLPMPVSHFIDTPKTSYLGLN